ncbi:MAG: hypothetical protein AMXMBFR33_36850 [Candidatus Xenobia bacterium]
MEITSPARSVIEPALRQRRALLIGANDFEGAERAEQDLETLSQAPGKDLYEMHRLASEHGRGIPPGYSFDVYLGRSNVYPTACLGVVAGALCTAASVIVPGLPLATWAGVGMMALSAGALAVGALRYQRAARAHRILDAIERNQDHIRGYVPSTR